MSARQAHSAETACRNAALALDRLAEQHATSNRLFTQHGAAVAQAWVSPAAIVWSQHLRSVIDRHRPAAELLAAAAVHLRSLADISASVAARFTVYEAELREAERQRTSSLLDPATVDPSGVEEARRRVEAAKADLWQTEAAWEVEVQTVARQVGELVHDLRGTGEVSAKVARALAAMADGTRIPLDLSDLGQATSTLARARDGHLGDLPARREYRPLVRAERRYLALRLRTAAHHLSGSDIAAKRKLQAQRRRARSQVQQHRQRFENLRHHPRPNSSLTRTAGRARALWNSPVRVGASRALGPVGLGFGVVDSALHLREGRYVDAGVSAVTTAAAAAMVAFPVVGATVVIAGTLYQNREAIAKGTKWAKDKVVRGFNRLFRRS